MALVDFVSQVTDVDIDDVGERVEIQVPDMFGYHGAGQYPSGIAHHVFEKGIFFGCEFDALASPRDLMRDGVQNQVVDLQDSRGFTAGSSQQRPGAGQQFLDGKGFGEVIVGSGIQAFDALVHFGAGGQNENGGFDFFGANAFQDFQAGKGGKHEIENDQVVIDCAGEIAALLSIRTHIDRVAFFFQCSPNE